MRREMKGRLGRGRGGRERERKEGGEGREWCPIVSS
jgi:hypothetical protein